ncbi:DNA repair protein RecN [Peptoniphilus sp. GNH]|nr:DNA repair protein RecN [Peptoniphilus sp. GNH]
MLLELNVQNFAIIDDIKIEFTSGFNVLTGETGSGKSIIIDALALVLGKRANKDSIRNGRESAFIEALFSVDDEYLINYLDDLGFGLDSSLIISREIFKDKPSKLRINGRLAQMSTLKEITSQIIDIFAQEESQSLMDLSNQRELLDSFAPKEQIELLTQMKNTYKDMKILKDKYDAAAMDESKRQREVDILDFQIKEIDDANLKEDDFSTLEDEYKKAANSEKILKNLKDSLCILKTSDRQESVVDGLDRIISLLDGLENFTNDFEFLKNDILDIRYRLDDIACELEDQISLADIDESEIDRLISRIDIVNNLKSKYGESLAKILDFRDESANRLAFLENLDKERENLKKSLENLEIRCKEIADCLTQNRIKAGEFLTKSLDEEFKQLNMSDAKFRLDLKAQDLGPDGKDQIEYMIKTNIGEDFKPLSKIASGGEMSRMMLGFKSILARKDKISCLIFDEIDTGISGRTARIVAGKIKNLSKERQVIAVSHLPQIVASADSHYLIEKKHKDRATFSNIRKLDEKERVEEVARLLGGIEITKASLDAAKELIDEGRDQ